MDINSCVRQICCFKFATMLKSATTTTFVWVVLLHHNNQFVNCDMSHPSVEDSFKQCLVSQPNPSIGHCFGVGAISKLQSLDSDREFDLIDGLTMIRDPGQEYRADYSVADRDPADFRTWIDSLSHVFQARSMHWDMGFIYPGLGMRVAPSAGPGGTLEFILDPTREAYNKHSLKELGTGRLLARQFLVPFLLGFKFNVVTLIPILFGLLALLAKKAIFLSKIALIVSSAYGLGALMLGNNNKFQQGGFHSGNVGPAQFHSTFSSPYNRYPDEEYQEVIYRGMRENTPSASNVDTNNSEKNADQLRLYANLQNAFDRDDKHHQAKKGRNFAWNEDEKEKKAVPT